MEKGCIKVAYGQITKNKRGRERRSCNVAGKVIKGGEWEEEGHEKRREGRVCVWLFCLRML